MFHGISDDEINDTLDTFWSEYTASNYKNAPFDGYNFILISKEIREDDSHLWNHNYFLPCTIVLVFLAYRVTSKLSVLVLLNILGATLGNKIWEEVFYQK